MWLCEICHISRKTSQICQFSVKMLGRQDLCSMSWLQLERAIWHTHQVVLTLMNLPRPLYFVGPLIVPLLQNFLQELVNEWLMWVGLAVGWCRWQRPQHWPTFWLWQHEWWHDLACPPTLNKWYHRTNFFQSLFSWLEKRPFKPKLFHFLHSSWHNFSAIYSIVSIVWVHSYYFKFVLHFHTWGCSFLGVLMLVLKYILNIPILYIQYKFWMTWTPVSLNITWVFQITTHVTKKTTLKWFKTSTAINKIKHIFYEYTRLWLP